MLMGLLQARPLLRSFSYWILTSTWALFSICCIVLSVFVMTNCSRSCRFCVATDEDGRKKWTENMPKIARSKNSLVGPVASFAIDSAAECHCDRNTCASVSMTWNLASYGDSHPPRKPSHEGTSKCPLRQCVGMGTGLGFQNVYYLNCKLVW